MGFSTATTLGGLMERIQADSLAVFKTQSGLYNAARVMVSNGANSVQFPSFSAPSAASSLAQGSAVSNTTITISAVAATLAAYPVLAQVTNLALNGGQDVSMDIALQLAGNIAATVDTNICAQFANFTGGTVGSAGSALTIDSLISALGALDATKFSGQKVIVLHPKGFSQIAKDVISVAGLKKEEVMGQGYIANIFGAELYVSPYVSVDGSDDATSAVYIKNAIGLAHKDPLFELQSLPNLAYAATDFLAATYHAVAMVQAGAGIKLVHDTVA